MSEELKRESFQDLPPATVVLSEENVPVKVVLQETTHDKLGEFRAMVLKDAPFMDAKKVDEILEKIAASGKGKPTKEYHMLLLVKCGTTYKGYASLAHSTDTPEGIHNHGTSLMGEAEGEEARIPFELTALHLTTTPDWKGTRTALHELEATTLDEMKQKLAAAGIANIFWQFVSEGTSATLFDSSMKPAKAAKLSAAKRAELVAKFGEDNIKALEAKTKKN